jgi:CRP/FNR family transcriptional regulator
MSAFQDDFKTTALRAALRACPLFSELPPAELARVATFAQFRSLRRGAYLFREGEPSHGFYIVRSGTISVHRSGANGREQVIQLFRTGASFAEASLAEPARYPADARAEQNSEVILIPRPDFLALLKTRPELALRMLAAMSRHLRTLVDALDDLTRKDVETRLAHWLLARCPQPLTAHPCELRLDVTKSVLAAELHTRHETLSRALARLRELQLVAGTGRIIRVLDPLRLDAVLRANFAGAQSSAKSA